MNPVSRIRSAVALAAVLPAIAMIGPAHQADAAPDHATRPIAPVTLTVVGQVVRFSSGRPVRDVRVSAYNASDGPDAFLGADLTDANGKFVIRNVEADDDEFGIYVQGRRVGLQNGWLGFRRLLHPTFGEASTWSSRVGTIRIRTS